MKDNFFLSVGVLLPTPTPLFTRWEAPTYPRIGEIFRSFNCFFLLLSP
jgi:hypothetical protein